MRQRAILGNEAALRAVLLTVALLAVAGGVCVAQGTVFRYAADRQVVKVCVLQIPDPAAPGTYYPVANPMVFSVLDQLPQKPGDWQLDNPLAPPGAVRDTPAYWVVPLNPGSAERLTEFDVILINTQPTPPGPTNLLAPVFPFLPATPEQSTSDVLRKIADHGVTLWFDGGAGMTTAPWGFGRPHFNLDFVATGGFGKVITDPRHPLMTSPFAFAPGQIGFLGTAAAQNVLVAGYASAMQEVVSDAAAPLPRVAVAAGTWAGGRIVATSCDISGAIASIGLGARVMPPELPDVMFAVNLLAWSGEWASDRQSPRNTAVTPASALPPLGIKWQYPGPMDIAGPFIGPAVGSPVVLRGMVYYAARAAGAAAFAPGVLLAFDADPRTDLDGDGRPDDGAPDFSIGEPYDLVWTAPLAGDPFSASPTAVTADASLFPPPLGGPVGAPFPLVLAPSSDGTDGFLQAFNASTGAVVWSRTFPPRFAPSTVAVSTPAIRDGWVFFTTTDGVAGPPINPANGIVYCVDLPTGGAALTWTYPDVAFGEAAVIVPPFAMVAAGGATVRIISAPAVYGKELDKVGRPMVADAILRLAGGTGPGMDFEAVPLPTNNYTVPGGAALNDGNGATTPRWFSVSLPVDYTPPIDAVLQDDGVTAFPPADYLLNAPMGCVTLSQQAARTYIAAKPDPTGRDVIIQYTDASGPGKTITRRLPGVLQAIRSMPAWQRLVSPVVGEQAVFAARSAAGPVPAKLHALRPSDSGDQWAYDPRVALDPSLRATNPAGTYRAAPAADADTVYVATSFDLDPADAITHPDGAALAALRSDPTFEVRLVGGANRIVDSVDPARVLQVQWVEGPGGVPGRLNSALPAEKADIVAPSFYTLDATRRTIRFRPEVADTVQGLDGTAHGAIYGRTVWISYFDDFGTPRDAPDDVAMLEVHVVPPIQRWQYVPYTVQLSWYPLLGAAGGYATPPDIAVTLVRDGMPILPPDYTVDARGGKLLFLAGSAAVGQQVDVFYRYQAPGPLGTPPVLVAAPERHVVPAPFRLCESAPAASGSTIHVGLEPGPAPGTTPGLLSLLWDKASKLVTAWLTPVAQVPVGYPGGLAPVVGAPPAVTQDSVYVGSSLSDLAPSELSGGAVTAFGFISALRSERTLIADANRVLETNGPRLSWVCTGTQLVDPQVPTTVKMRPFVRPSKVTKLSGGTLLVVDTGNSRVVEIDREGNLLWPLTALGDEEDFVITGVDPAGEGLREPGDACRYYGDGPGGPVQHTVVADTGNGRIVDVLTTYGPGGQQIHGMTVLTPDFLPNLTSGKAVRIAYSHVQPVFANPGPTPDDRAVTAEPAGGARLVGYLCSATNVQQLMVVNADRGNWPNVINPTGPVGGMAGVGWKWCDWLYDMNQDGVAADPVFFNNVRFTEITQFGQWMYFTVVCSSWGDGAVFSPNGPGVYQFQVSAAGPVAARGLNPGNQTAISMGGVPFWEFNHSNYLWLDAPANTAPRLTSWLDFAAGLPKRWHPVCAKILPNGDRLITNNAALMANATRANLPGTAADNSEILQVYNAPGFPIDPDRMVPSPNWPEWADPFSQPMYAEVN